MNRLVLLLVVAANLQNVMGHGFLIHPPQRSSMWRVGFDAPIDYDDNALFCGGFAKQYDEVNQGRCGECGDEWSLPRPRLHDEGGLYGTGIIGATYQQGELVNMTVEITAAHLGYFEFKLCNKSSAEELTTQECLDSNVLQQADGSTKYYGIGETGLYDVEVQLPADISCDHCVIQWHYKAGIQSI